MYLRSLALCVKILSWMGFASLSRSVGFAQSIWENVRYKPDREMSLQHGSSPKMLTRGL